MEMQYKFSLGGIEEILKGKAEKADSLDELNIEVPKKNKIIIPKIIGVYQRDNVYNEEVDKVFLEIMEQISVFTKTGERENLSPDLICVIYDPTIIKKDILKQSLRGDVLNRVKCEEYSPELPDFYEKKLPDLDVIKRASLDHSLKNITVLKRALEHLKLLKEDYGLTRFEALGLAAGQAALHLSGETPRIEDNPHILKLGESFLDFLKDSGFSDFFKKI